jgi:hypothetical protein
VLAAIPVCLAEPGYPCVDACRVTGRVGRLILASFLDDVLKRAYDAGLRNSGDDE